MRGHALGRRAVCLARGAFIGIGLRVEKHSTLAVGVEAPTNNGSA
jgi:hypothetical protein